MHYRFVHIPKTGGSFFCHLCYRLNLPIDWSPDMVHTRVCEQSNDVTNIVIIRNPVLRFISAYNHYLHGCEKWPEKNKGGIGPARILDMVQTSRIHRFDFEKEHVYEALFRRQLSWIPPNSYKNTILVYYSYMIHREFQELFDSIGIETSLSHKTVNEPEDRSLILDNLSTKLEEKINFVYNQDRLFYYNVDRNRKFFKKVIGNPNEH